MPVEIDSKRHLAHSQRPVQFSAAVRVAVRPTNLRMEEFVLCNLHCFHCFFKPSWSNLRSNVAGGTRTT